MAATQQQAQACSCSCTLLGKRWRRKQLKADEGGEPGRKGGREMKELDRTESEEEEGKKRREDKEGRKRRRWTGRKERERWS
jgi:hypothetical protein